MLLHVSGTCVAFRPSPFLQPQTMLPSASTVGVSDIRGPERWARSSAGGLAEVRGTARPARHWCRKRDRHEVVAVDVHAHRRIGELAKAEWAHLDFDRAEWFVPDANSKGKKGFTVPLTPAALASFKALKPLAGNSRFVFPARQIRRTRNHGGADVHSEP